jgi:mannose-1-phosphate guanylyltransferase/phosphomannomutase
MKGVILSAGMGERLAPLSLDVPKPMAPLLGRPLLEHAIALLRTHGVREIFINVHHRGYKIQEHFGDGRAFGVEISYFPEPTLSGTAGPLRHWRNELSSGTFVVMYGDILTDLDICGLVDFHVSQKAGATIAVHRTDQPERCGIVSFTTTGLITRFQEKPRPDEAFSSWANAGIYALEPSVFDFIPRVGAVDFGHDVFPAMLSGGAELFSYAPNGYLLDIGDPQRYAMAECDLRSGKCATYVAR